MIKDSIRRWGVEKEQWDDWQWQIKNRITETSVLSQVIEMNGREMEAVNQCLKRFRMSITPYYASLMDSGDRHCPVRLQAVPRPEELKTGINDMRDPLHEDRDSPVQGLTHRYPDRVLLLATDICSVYCRHCTRRRLIGSKDSTLPKAQLDRAIGYIQGRTEIRDVVISGGDPFTMNDAQIEYMLMKLRAIRHVDIIRIGTRVPVVLPQRITKELCEMLEKYHPVWINTHFNHPREITPESARACDRLTRAGIPLGNQSVLLKGVNDRPEVIIKLVQGLLKIRVRPYYLYQCDLSEGIGHFRTPVSVGIEIIENLRGHTSGLAVPTFVVDAPGGGGKIPVMPNYILSQGQGKVVLRNFEGKVYMYTESDFRPEENISKKLGIAGLMQGSNKEFDYRKTASSE